MSSKLIPIPLVAPGSLGINSEQEFALLDPRWCLHATNAILDQNGQLRSRNGWVMPEDQTALSGSFDFEQLFEYVQKDGDTEIISAAHGQIYKGLGDFTDTNNKISAYTAAHNNFKFVNFNDKVLGWQDGEDPIFWAGSGDFDEITAASGSVPDGNEVCAAFGRVWTSYADKQTIGYSALLDETKWAGADGGGTIDMSKLWTLGMDEVVAIRALGANLVVFGKRHIVLWADGTGSQVGLAPSAMVVTDTIEGTGAIARDAIAPIGEGDLAFLSPHGIQLLGRVIVDKNNPIASVTKNYKSALDTLLRAEHMESIRAVYSVPNRLYLLVLPVNKMVVALDTRFVTDQDGDVVARVTEWRFNNEPHSICQRLDGDLLLGFNGRIGTYQEYTDNGSPYQFEYLSVWLKIDPQIETLLKIIKELRALVITSGAYNVKFQWSFDFGTDTEAVVKALEAEPAAEYNEAEFGEDEYSGGNFLRVITVDGSGEGKYLQVGVSTTIDGLSMAIQQLQFLAKLGRMD